MKLAILICTLPERKQLLNRLVIQLLQQMNDLDLTGGVGEMDTVECEMDVCILINEDNREKTTGKKRNELVELAVKFGANTVAFVDDDDLVGVSYLKTAMEFVNSDCDCCELWGNIYWSGKKGKPFHHSIEYKEWYEDDKTYFRTPNHLNFMRVALIKDIPFPCQNFGEDGQASYAWRDAGVFKKQMPCSDVLYHYYVGEPKYELA